MKLLPLALFAGLALSAHAAPDGLALATKNNCMACHQVATKVVGPSYKDVAKKYAAQKNAEAMLIGKIKKGGSGTWGPVPMPPQTASEADLKVIVKWILSQK
ncbi:c-type cytochrome [Chitinimonas sp. BJYL2]|uniref:c-type cytochrome n=1 Tax=Chitinimonas sp. BJYL2 TaxID=2976696 RepID=UPI0022B5505D|nr:c-type cytochrome [Chitinimonas sp. BJYL2]